MKKRFTDEQFINVLNEAEAGLSRQGYVASTASRKRPTATL